jgi:hypothetical protein
MDCNIITTKGKKSFFGGVAGLLSMSFSFFLFWWWNKQRCTSLHYREKEYKYNHVECGAQANKAEGSATKAKLANWRYGDSK